MKSHDFSTGYFGSSTGAAALVAAPTAPTLLIVGGDDVVIELNQDAMSKMSCTTKLEAVS